MAQKTRQLRDLLASGEFLYMPSATTPIDSSGVGDQQYIDRTRDLAGDPHLLVHRQQQLADRARRTGRITACRRG
jgi:hypothetical protein